MRVLTRFLQCFTLTACVLPTYAAQLDPNIARDAVKIAMKSYCSTVDGEMTTFWWEGKAFSRRQGERDRHLFNVEGMNTRACVSDDHVSRGQGFRLVSKEILLYRDPKTNEVLDSWQNPWTNETVRVLHVLNDPVNMAVYEKGRNGKPFFWSGRISEGKWRLNITVPLFYPNHQ